jgi:SAM-dependent methyltransferase
VGLGCVAVHNQITESGMNTTNAARRADSHAVSSDLDELPMSAGASGRHGIRLDLSVESPLSSRAGAARRAAAAAGWTLIGTGPMRDASIDWSIELDVTRKTLPYVDASVDMIYAAFTLEAVPAPRLPAMLAEWRRVLKPGAPVESADSSTLFEGGLLRIVVRDMAAAVGALAERDEAFFERQESAFQTGAVQQGVGVPDRGPSRPLGERFAAWLRRAGPGASTWFDHETIMHHLRAAGFDGMYRSACRKSLLPELRSEAFDQPTPDVLYLEAWATQPRVQQPRAA